MTLLSLFKDSNKKTAHTLINGDDAFLNEYIADSYIHDKKMSEYEKISVDCDSEGLDELIADLTESSLFSQKKIITIKNPFFLTAKVPKKFQKQISKLQNVFANIAELDDVLVIVASYEKIDRRKKITKLITKNFNVVETKIRPFELSKTVRNLISMEGYQITSSALNLLLERSDQVLDTVLGNYNKLKMVANDKKITTELVKKNVDLSLAQNIFAILDSALSNNYQEALARLSNQLHNGNNPIQILAVFENQLEMILIVKVLSERGRSEAEIVQTLGVHPYRVKLALKNRLSLGKVAKLLKQAIKLDFNYKSGQYQESNFLKLFILSV